MKAAKTAQRWFQFKQVVRTKQTTMLLVGKYTTQSCPSIEETISCLHSPIDPIRINNYAAPAAAYHQASYLRLPVAVGPPTMSLVPLKAVPVGLHQPPLPIPLRAVPTEPFRGKPRRRPSRPTSCRVTRAPPWATSWPWRNSKTLRVRDNPRRTASCSGTRP